MTTVLSRLKSEGVLDYKGTQSSRRERKVKVPYGHDAVSVGRRCVQGLWAHGGGYSLIQWVPERLPRGSVT